MVIVCWKLPNRSPFWCASCAANEVPPMKYCDLHCDALTASGAPQVTKARLISGGCLLQCFAAFVEEGGYARFFAACGRVRRPLRARGVS